MKTASLKTVRTAYWLLISSFCVRMFWMVVMEPRGMKKVIANFPDHPASATLPSIVYSSIVILAIIMVGAFLKKKWSYTAGLVFGIIHFFLIIYMPIAGLNPGYGPIVVTSACVLMIGSAWVTLKNAHLIPESRTTSRTVNVS